MAIDMTGSFHKLQLEGCDRCGKRASYEVMLAGGSHLRFCSHHWVDQQFTSLAYMHLRDL